MSPHCWISTLTVTFGYLALKSALTPSTTACGALPFINQTVSVPVWFAGLLAVLPHAVATIASATAPTLNHLGLSLIRAISPFVLNAARARQVVGRLHA